jgi:NAD(P)-dependent dehydrogenase (short-subunit alcohol dehydrogenase family)
LALFGSALAYRTIPLQSAYCAAKHAVPGFTESLRAELLHDQSHVRLTIVHLPALNTPQFEWTRSRLPRRAQPVPPIFQPGVAVRGIVWAARHPRREVWVGGPTVKAIIADKVAPGLADRYLAGPATRPSRPGSRQIPIGAITSGNPRLATTRPTGASMTGLVTGARSSGRPRTEPCWRSASVLPRSPR